MGFRSFAGMKGAVWGAGSRREAAAAQKSTADNFIFYENRTVPTESPKTFIQTGFQAKLEQFIPLSRDGGDHHGEYGFGSARRFRGHLPHIRPHSPLDVAGHHLDSQSSSAQTEDMALGDINPTADAAAPASGTAAGRVRRAAAERVRGPRAVARPIDQCPNGR